MNTESTKAKYSKRGIYSLMIPGIFFSMSCSEVMAQESPVAPAPGAVPQDQRMAQMKQIQDRLDRVNQKIVVAQQAAMGEVEVQREQVVYSQLLDEKVVEADPSMQETIKKERALVVELQGSPELQMPTENRSSEFQQKLERYRELQQVLSVKRADVSEEGEVVNQRRKVEEVLIAKMTEIEPETPELLQQRASLSQNLQELQR